MYRATLASEHLVNEVPVLCGRPGGVALWFAHGVRSRRGCFSFVKSNQTLLGSLLNVNAEQGRMHGQHVCVQAISCWTATRTIKRTVACVGICNHESKSWGCCLLSSALVYTLGHASVYFTGSGHFTVCQSILSQLHQVHTRQSCMHTDLQCKRGSAQGTHAGDQLITSKLSEGLTRSLQHT